MTSSPEKYINLFTDFGFKKIFGTEFNKELLIDFLNQVLNKRERVQTLTYLGTEHSGKTAMDRKAIFDLYCENEKGEKFIIELQNIRQEHFKDRSIYYSTFPIQGQAPKGSHWDYCLKAVFTIGIVNFALDEQSDNDRYLHEARLMDRHTKEIFYDKLTFIYLEVQKFEKGENELDTPFDKWMYILKNLHKLQKRPRKLQEKIFEKLFSEAEIAKLSPEEMNAYEQSLKIHRDNYSIKKTLERAKEETRKAIENAVKAKKDAVKAQEDAAKAKEAGKLEEKIEIAKILIKNGAPAELVEKSTGLTKEQIEKLKRL